METPKGDLLAWGNNRYGQLGDDSTDESDVPGDLATMIGSGPASSAAFAITTQH
jgi:alpha-tubulin suppressor-like RCC1 family protein